MINLAKLFLSFWLFLQGPAVPGRTGAVVGGGGAAGTWSFIANGTIQSGNSGTNSTNFNFSPVPAVHDTVVGCIGFGFTPTGPITITDSGNTYTISAGSPAHNTTGTRWVYLFYLLNAATGGGIITASWTSGTGYAWMSGTRFLDSHTGLAAFDRDVINGATDVTDPSTAAIVNPSITPTAGDLLYSCASTVHQVSAPTAGGTSGGWTGTGVAGGGGAEYILNATGAATAVSMTGNTTSDPYASMALGLKP